MISIAETHRTTPIILGSPEYQVIAHGIPRGGLVEDRPCLPADIETEIIKLLKPKMDAEAEVRAQIYLKHIFASAAQVDGAHATYTMRMDRNAESATQGSDAKRQEKAVTRASCRLANHASQYLHLKKRSDRTPEETSRYIAALPQDIGVWGALNAVLCATGGRHLDWHRHPQMLESVFRSLDAAFELAKTELAAARRPGRDQAVLKQLCRALAALYHDVTGELPTRRVDAYSNKDTEYGPFLEICRLMALALDEFRVDRGQKPIRSRMAKLVRVAVEELKRKPLAT